MEITHDNLKIQLLTDQQGKQHILAPLGCTIEDLYIRDVCPLILKNVIEESFTWQLRSKTTLRDSLMLRTINPFWLGILSILNTRVKHENNPVKSLLIEELVTSGNKGALAEIEIPVYQEGRKLGWSMVAPTPKNSPIVGSYASIVVENKIVTQAVLALTGVSSNRINLSPAVNEIVGHELTSDRINQVSSSVFANVNPIGDYRGSIEYRKEMARVTTERALTACLIGEKTL